MARKIIIPLLVCVSLILTAERMSSQELAGIPGSHLLQTQMQELAAAQSANQARIAPLQKQTAWNFSVGTTRDWWATSLVTYTEYVVNSTCRAVGMHCYVFVEDSMWGSRVTQEAVDAIVTAFDAKTPTDSTKGIYELSVEYFGSPPDVDSDPRIIILVLNILDSFSGSGSYVAGYFYSLNEFRDPQGSHRSNEAEIYYLDANPANLSNPSSFNAACSVTAHEFQHMIHFNYDGNEDSFVNEGMSESASKLCGYSLRSPSHYYSNTNVSFMSWGTTPNVLNDYSRTALFSWYMVEQFGSALTKLIVSRTANGATGYNDAFTAMGSSLRFGDVLTNFSVATSLNKSAYDSRYGFLVPISIYPTPQKTYGAENVPTTADTVLPYGTKVYSFFGGDLLKIQYSSTAQIAVQILGAGPVLSFAGLLPAQTEFTLNDYPSDLTQATMTVTNLSTSSASFTYSATMLVPSDIPAEELAGTALPSHMALSSNYPNPFNPSTTFRLSLPREEQVVVEVFDVAGRRVDELANGVLSAGEHPVVWKPLNRPSGMYFVRAQTASESTIRKVALVQ